MRLPHGWSFESIDGYVYNSQQTGTVPFYKYWNPTIAAHFFTTDYNELGQGNYGYYLQGISCWVSP